MPTSDSDRILARGAAIALADGREVQVRYSMRSIKLMEDRYGSLTAIQSLVETDENGLAVGRTVGPLMELLAFGLLHEGISEDDLLDLAEPPRLEEYATAVNAALEQAFPAKEKSQGNGRREPTNGSRGRTSTTAPRSSSAAATGSSGT